MLNNRTYRVICFAVILLITITALVVCQIMDRQFCMGVPVIEIEELDKYQEGWQLADPQDITFCGERVPVVKDRIFISQPREIPDHFSDLKGTLSNKNRNQKMYFVYDEALFDMEKTMKDGKCLSLVIIEEGYYCILRVALTSLPILRMEGDKTERFSANGRPVYSGNITLFLGRDDELSHIYTQTYCADWFARGASSASRSKNPWKLSFKNKEGEKKNESFLGMGEDDDWILNPMNMEDTKLREKFAMDLWNQNMVSSDSKYKMSVSEYVEVIINGEYKGLYLLQRRIDVKYLGLNNSQDILIKGKNTWKTTELKKEYEIVYSPLGEEETYEILERVISQCAFDIDNFIKCDLFLRFCNALDNVGYKNMYYLLCAEEQGYRVYLVPWDTDMSFGMRWRDGFVYEYDESMKQRVHRQEYENIRNLHLEFDEMYKQYWNELRETAFSPQRMEQHIRSLQERIESSGARQRDQVYWDLNYKGEDTVDELIRWCKERTRVFDLEYGIQ